MKNISLLFVIIFALINTATSQFVEPVQSERKTEVKIGIEDIFKTQQALATQILNPELISTEGAIDPERYVLGPGDVLNFTVWSSPPLSFPIQVTIEGTLIIPTVGEIKVAGLTLSEAKKLVIQKAKSKYIASEITATLTLPRTFYVTVTGTVLNPGKVRVRAMDRVSTALMLSFIPSDSFQILKKDSLAQIVSLRKITLRRGEKILTADLVKYYATGDERYNPTLLDGDWIFVPRKDPNSFVSIYGAVNKPGTYEFVEGDKLTDIIKIAGGTIESADVENIEIIRLDEQGKMKEKIVTNLNEIQNGTKTDIKLENNDRIFIPEKRTLKQDYKVMIAGEVTYPGTYPISRNGTMLSEILKKAGVNRFSDIDNAIVIQNPEKRFIEQIDKLFPLLFLRNFGLSSIDSLYFSFELQTISSIKFVAINLADVLAGKNDYTLNDGDLIYIPPKFNLVYVFGQVNSPGFVPFERGKDYKHYIAKAGGFSQLARKGDVKIIKRKTYNWYDAGDVEIEPGDYIFVPKKIVRESIYYWNLSKDIILTVGAVASTVATILLIYNQVKAR